MKEKLYTIPVMDAFKSNCECPICELYRGLEEHEIEFTMGSSYMEDDVRMDTDKVGFCNKHIQLLYKNQNRLGLALMMKTHMDKVISDINKLSAADANTSKSFFKKSKEEGKLSLYLSDLDDSCYICNRINKTFDRYLVTILYLYRKEDEFKSLFNNAKGICTHHYKNLLQFAHKELSGDMLSSFTNDLNHLYLHNLEKVRDDLTWFIDKFDYRNNDKPWGDSKDALPRAIQAMDGVKVD